jgi:LysR family transcriptional regulator, chromosome initiation inhibitor
MGISVTNVKLDHLKALAAAVDTGSFEAAALALHLTPSAVSQRIKALESSAGQVLVRRSRPTTVTQAGESYLRLARQIDSLVSDAGLGESETVSLPLAMSSDALATWVLPALATVGEGIVFDLQREDQDHSADLLRAGSVMAAITTDANPVQGCTVTRLGTMRYRPMATREFVRRWFPDGVTTAALATAPIVVFDRKDQLQDRYLRSRSRARLDPPRHYIPGSQDFAASVGLGLGWGMIPDQQATDAVVEFDHGSHVDVELYWQQWTLRTRALDAVAAAVIEAARVALDQRGERR